VSTGHTDIASALAEALSDIAERDVSIGNDRMHVAYASDSHARFVLEKARNVLTRWRRSHRSDDQRLEEKP
jgi:hypothetical protein